MYVYIYSKVVPSHARALYCNTLAVAPNDGALLPHQRVHIMGCRKAQQLLLVRMRRTTDASEQLQAFLNVYFKWVITSEMKDMFWDSGHHDSDA
jgi:hypothetical protein